MFIIDTKNIKRLERDLKRFACKAYPFATRKTLNDAAFQAQRIDRTDVAKNMIMRNRFTVRSIQVKSTRVLQVRRQYTVGGSTAGYMEDQEFGVTQYKTGKEGIAIATSYSSGEGEGVRIRRRLPKKANRIGSIRLSKRRKNGSRKQRNFLAIRQAARSSNKFVFLNLGKHKGIFRVVGGKRRTKIKMVQDLTKQFVVIPKNPWLKPVFDETIRMLPAFYADAIRFQLRRKRIFSL